MLTGRPKVLVYSYCYHGSVDEAFAVAVGGPRPSRGRERRAAGGRRADDDRDRVQRPRRAGGGAAHRRDRLRAGRAGDDQHGHRAARRRLPRRAAGADARARDAADHRRDAHVLAPGRAAAPRRGGSSRTCSRSARRSAAACRAARSASRRASRRGCSRPRTPTTSTPAASAARWPATRSRWRRCGRRSARVLTDDVWEHTIPLAARFAEGVRAAVGERGLERHAAGLPRRVPLPGRAGPQRHRGARGRRTPSSSATCTCTRSTAACCITPFHNMALMAPTTTADDVDRHTAVFAEALQAL